MRAEETPFLYPSPAAHLAMGVTLSLRERNVKLYSLQRKRVDSFQIAKAEAQRTTLDALSEMRILGK